MALSDMITRPENFTPTETGKPVTGNQLPFNALAWVLIYKNIQGVAHF